jgi:hypothetical protein
MTSTHPSEALVGAVNTDDVWRLVEQARTGLGHDAADMEALGARMAEILAEREPADILAFNRPIYELLATSYRADLWAAAYLINGGASDDGFEYFRGWLIGQGQEVFEETVADPDSLADYQPVIDAAVEGDELEGQDVLTVVWTAYRRATGEDPPPVGRIEYPDLEDEWFDFDSQAEMREHLPRLVELYSASDDDEEDDDF